MKKTTTSHTPVWKQKKWKMMLAASILTAGAAPALVTPSVAEAAATVKPTAYINNMPAEYDVVIRQGVTYIALTELQFLGNNEEKRNQCNPVFCSNPG